MKILIFKKNSPWGVIKDPVKGNIYNHTIDFLDDNNKFSQSLKDLFINVFLGDDEKGDYKLLLEEMKDCNWTPLDEIKFSFFSSPEQQNNRMTNRELELSDFCVVKQDGEYLFYTLKVIQSYKQKVYFEAELDIFFTYNLQMRNNTVNFIKYSHLNRWQDKDNINKQILMNKVDVEAPLIIQNQQPIHFGNPIWKKIKWFVVYLINDNGCEVKVNRTERIKLPYKILLYPFSVERNKITIISRQTGFQEEINFAKFQEQMTDNQKLLSIHILDNIPAFMTPLNLTISESGLLKDITITFNGWVNAAAFWLQNNCLELRRINNYDFDQMVNTTNISLKLWNNPWKERVAPFLSASAKISNEIGLWNEAYFLLGLKKWDTEVKKYPLQHLKIPLEFNFVYTFQPEIYQTISWLSSNIRDNFLAGHILINKQIQEIPTSQDKYKEYVRNNRSKIDTDKGFDWGQVGLSLVSVAAGVSGGVYAKSMTTTFAGAGGGAAGIMGAAKSLEMRESTIEDIKRMVPAVSSGNNIFVNFGLGKKNTAEVLVVEMKPNQFYQEKIWDFIKTKGYQVNKLAPIIPAIRSRYHYNYIEGEDVFNTISNKLSPKVKQIIDDAFSTGITFWHFRSLGHWTNILDYTKENWEWDILKSEGLLDQQK